MNGQLEMFEQAKAPIWHFSLNHVWEECPTCHVQNKSQKFVKVGYGAESQYVWVNRARCPECGQLFDWSDEAIEKVAKYSKDYLKAQQERTN